MSFRELRSTNPDYIALACENCWNGEKVAVAVRSYRKDTFLIGLHVAQCPNCWHQSSEIYTLDGEIKKVTAEAHKDGGV